MEREADSLEGKYLGNETEGAPGQQAPIGAAAAGVTPMGVAARGAGWDLLRGRGWWLALAASLALLMAWGGYAPLFNPDEGRYASASLEMVGGLGHNAPDWVVPHLNGVPRLNKPPLIYWCAAAAMRVLGATEAASRLPSMLAGGAVALLLWAWGRRAVDELTGRLAALLWLSCAIPFAFSRIANTDMLLAAALALATFGVWIAIDNGRASSGLPAQVLAGRKAPAPGKNAARESALEPSHGSAATETVPWARSPELRGGLIAGIGMGLALLAKGPVGLVFPLGTGLVALIATRRLGVLRSRLVWASLGVALVIALAVALPWVAAVSARVPGFLRRFLIDENLGRYSGAGGVEFHKASPVWYYVPVILAGLLPWSPFLLAATRGRDERERRALWFWGAWAALVIVLFSLSKTKLASYVLPAFAPLSLMLGFFFAARIQAEESQESQGSQAQPQVLEAPRRRAPQPTGRSATKSAAASSKPSGRASRAGARDGVRWRASLWASLVLQAILVAVGSFFLLSDKVVPRAVGLPLVAGLALAQAVGVAGIIGALTSAKDGSRNGARGVFLWGWAGAGLLHVVLLIAAGRVAAYEDSGAPMRALAPYMKPEDRLVLFQEFQPSAIFYARRPAYIVDFVNNSGLDEAAIARSPFFPRFEPRMLERWRRDGRRTFLLCRSTSPFLPELLKSWTLVARTNDHHLLCNHDAPKGFRYDFVAPKKRER